MMAADAGMDTCSSPEIGDSLSDSRKRPLDGDTENGTNKRSHFSSGEFLTFHYTSIISLFIFTLKYVFYFFKYKV